MAGDIHPGSEFVSKVLEAAGRGESMLVLTRTWTSVDDFVGSIASGLGLEVVDISEEEFKMEADKLGLVLALLTGQAVIRPVSLTIISLNDGVVMVLVTPEFIMLYGVSDMRTYILYHSDEEGYCLRVGRGIGLVLTSDAPPLAY